jgi:hypothetical protein
LIDEVKLNPEINADLIEAFKHAVQGETARTKLTITSEQIHVVGQDSLKLTEEE